MGQRVGDYTIIRTLGEGGMGTVWLAEHELMGQRALKMMHANFIGQPGLAQRFLNEARAAATIRHPGIVQVFHVGQHVDGRAYIVMELLEGEPLDQRLARMGRLALPDALRILRQIASALGAAHQLGIVHRDLKPENVFIVRDAEVSGGERAKLLDFGIAKISDRAGDRTEPELVMGTPAFMSPEQCRGAGLVDPRSDVYSLGCVAFNLLTGRPLFPGGGPGDIIAMHLREPPPPPSAFVAGLPEGVDALVLRCLEKDPDRRFASAAETAAALERLEVSTQKMRGLASQQATFVAGLEATPQPDTPLSRGTYAVTQEQAKLDVAPRARWWSAFAIAATLIAGGALAAVTLRNPRGASVGALLTKLPRESSGELWTRFSRINRDAAAADPELHQIAMERLDSIERDARSLLQQP